MSTQTGPIYSAEQIRIPPELPEILKNYAKFIIKNQPEDIIGSSAAYFTKLVNQTKQAGKDGKLNSAQLATFLKKFQISKPIATRQEIKEACEWADVTENQREDTLAMGGWNSDQVPWMHFFGFLVASVGGNFLSAMNLAIALGSDHGILHTALFKSIFEFLAEQDKTIKPDFVAAVTRYLSNTGNAIQSDRIAAKMNQYWDHPDIDNDLHTAMETTTDHTSAAAEVAAPSADAEMES